MAPDGGSLHYAIGPLIALVAVAGLLLASRWVFSTTHRTRTRAQAAPAGGSALLVGVVEVRDRAAADAARSLLADAGVRGLVVATDLGHELRVFPADVETARAVLRAG